MIAQVDKPRRLKLNHFSVKYLQSINKSINPPVKSMQIRLIQNLTNLTNCTNVHKHIQQNFVMLNKF